MKLSVIIPVYNERETLEELLRRVVAVELPDALSKELVLVDDCSRDGTREILQRLADQGLAALPGARPSGENELRVVFQPTNQGKGAALRRGFQEATGDLLMVQDADLEYDPNDYPALVQPILAGEADIVFGSRFLGMKWREIDWHSGVNLGLTLFSNLFTRLRLTDMETCYKVFKRECLQDLRIEEDRFGFEPEVTAKVARRGYRIREVRVRYYSRGYAEGKKIGWKDGVRALYAIVKYGALSRD